MIARPIREASWDIERARASSSQAALSRMRASRGITEAATPAWLRGERGWPPETLCRLFGAGFDSAWVSARCWVRRCSVASSRVSAGLTIPKIPGLRLNTILAPMNLARTLVGILIGKHSLGRFAEVFSGFGKERRIRFQGGFGKTVHPNRQTEKEPTHPQCLWARQLFGAARRPRRVPSRTCALAMGRRPKWRVGMCGWPSFTYQKWVHRFEKLQRVPSIEEPPEPAGNLLVAETTHKKGTT